MHAVGGRCARDDRCGGNAINAGRCGRENPAPTTLPSMRRAIDDIAVDVARHRRHHRARRTPSTPSPGTPRGIDNIAVGARFSRPQCGAIAGDAAPMPLPSMRAVISAAPMRAVMSVVAMRAVISAAPMRAVMSVVAMRAGGPRPYDVAIGAAGHCRQCRQCGRRSHCHRRGRIAGIVHHAVGARFSRPQCRPRARNAVNATIHVLPPQRCIVRHRHRTPTRRFLTPGFGYGRTASHRHPAPLCVSTFFPSASRWVSTAPEWIPV
jgi:hypothetical protein